MKKTVKLLILCTVIMLFDSVIMCENASAKKIKEYSVYLPDITSFAKTNSRLKLKAVKEWNHGIELNGKESNIKKLNLRLAKKCKWTSSMAGETKYKKSSYNKIKTEVKSERGDFKKYGEYESGSLLTITVSNNKVVRVNLTMC